MLFNEEGSSVDCTIEDTKLRREGKDREGEDNYLYTQAVSCDSATVNNAQCSWRFQGQLAVSRAVGGFKGSWRF